MPTLAHKLFGAILVALAAAVQFAVMGRAIAALNAGLVLAWFLWAFTKYRPDPEPLLPAYLFGLSVQCLHFCEEYLSGFQTAAPGLFGYAWSDRLFAAFNLLWLAVFLLAAIGVLRQCPMAYLVVFFYAIFGGIINGLGHIAISLALRDLFPGTLTAPFCLIAGMAVLKKLRS
jgi:hypothetical protein